MPQELKFTHPLEKRFYPSFSWSCIWQMPHF